MARRRQAKIGRLGDHNLAPHKSTEPDKVLLRKVPRPDCP